MECTHTGILFTELGLLTLFNINRLQTCCSMYKISRVALPLYFQNVFVLNNRVHSHNTRQAEKLHVILRNTNVRAFRVQVCEVKLWNDLDLTNCQELAIFRRKYQTFLINYWCILMLNLTVRILLYSYSKVSLDYYLFYWLHRLYFSLFS